MRIDRPTAPFVSFLATALLTRFGFGDGSSDFGSANLSSSFSSLQTLTFPFFTPCNFPVPTSSDPAQRRQNTKVCNVRHRVEFVCDLHFQLVQHNVQPIARAYEKHRRLFEEDDHRLRFGVLVVKQLAAPLFTKYVTEENPEFECLFRTDCLRVTPELLDKFVHSSRTFTKVYTMALFARWFQPRRELCAQPRVLALVVVDGLLADTRKLTSVNIYTDDRKFNSIVANVQLETTNALLQGVPLVEALADLVDQVGHAFRDYHAQRLRPRRRTVPVWAWTLAAVSVAVSVLALCLEWYVVRRRNAVKRSIPGLKVDPVRSKTHLIF